MAGYRSEGNPIHPIKWDFLQAEAILLYGCSTWTLTKYREKKASRELYKNATYCFEQIPEAESYKTAVV